MIITMKCPGCGTSYDVDEKRAGRRMKCKQCSEVMLVPDSEVAPKLRVECEHCGKGHWVSAEHNGKKTVCQNCGAMFRIVIGRTAPVRSESARPPSGRDVDPGSSAHDELDVYGLKEEPVVPLSGGGARSEDSAATGSGSDDSAPLPSRLKPYKPLSESQKKKIAKRAAKIEKTKASSATVGVSFGAVLAFALIGWRIYRIFNRIERAANRANAEQSAPAEVFAVDPTTAMAKMDKEVGIMIAQPTTAEARDWLNPDKYPNHAVMEMPVQTAREMVAGFYERGAEKVYVLDPSSVNGTLLTAQFAVRLPQDQTLRKRCFEWQAKHEGDESPAPDLGQRYLLITTD
jgi:hypothetical protein